MAKTRKEKEEILARCKNIFEAESPVVFVNFHGVTANEVNTLRSELHEQGLRYYVTKKTIADLALEDTPIEGERPETEGELALVYHENPETAEKDKTASARAIYAFQESFDERVKIVGGIFDNTFTDQEKMTAIAQIPGVKELRGQFVRIINAPVQKFAMVLNQIAEQKS